MGMERENQTTSRVYVYIITVLSLYIKVLYISHILYPFFMPSMGYTNLSLVAYSLERSNEWRYSFFFFFFLHKAISASPSLCLVHLIGLFLCIFRANNKLSITVEMFS